jgi:drug/metabolite transporter (DMT)-like permease
MSPRQSPRLRTIIATTMVMIAFAANSILCRLALGSADIDATGFTAIRLVSGAISLLAISLLSGRRRTLSSRGTWTSGTALFLYAIAFSLAYLRLDAGTGALILFAMVQAGMTVWGIAKGERPTAVQWVGFVLALGGLLYLVSPGLSAPPPLGAALMATAGVAWGIYSLRGRSMADPVVTTTDNFVRSVPLVLIAAALFFRNIDLSFRGAVLAVLSGSVASALGYVIWYAVLRELSATRAASVQLTVPAIAAIGGVVFLGEIISVRLVASSTLILGGVGLTFTGRTRRAQRTGRCGKSC